MACGTPIFSRTTTSPGYITCQACLRTLACADAEIAEHPTRNQFSR